MMIEATQPKNTLSPAELGRVGVLYGGVSPERAVSLQSGQAVFDGLAEIGVDAVLTDIGEEPMAQLQSSQIDAAFVALHGVGGEDGTIQAILEAMGIPYTGSGVASSALAIDKYRTKQMWQAMGFPTATYQHLSEHSDWSVVMAQLGGKAMVKPVREGSSLGMNIAESAAQLEQAYSKAIEHGSVVIAERWLAGREFTVGVLGEVALPVIELRTQEAFYNYEAKYISDETQFICPAPLDEIEYRNMQELAMDAFFSLGCRGWGRVDLMLAEDGKPHLLEVNTSPGMTSHSLLPLAALEAGVNFSELVLQITQIAVGKSR